MAIHVPTQITQSLDPARAVKLKTLTSAPPVAWPTVLTSVLMTAIYIASIVLAVKGHIPLWLGMLINAAIGYAVLQQRQGLAPDRTRAAPA